MQPEVLLGKIVVLVLGLVLLVKGSDFFVKAAAAIAKKLGVSEFVIGLTLVAVGTSIPELASSVAASLQQQSDIVMGNIVGSNIANIGLILGLAATIAVIKTREEMLKRDGYLMLFAALVLYLFIFNGTISRVEAVIFLLLYLAYILFLFKEKPQFKGEYGFREFLTYFFKFEYVKTVLNAVSNHNSRRRKNNKNASGPSSQPKEFKTGFVKDFVVLILGGAAVIVGAEYLVTEAVFFADYFQISKMLIGITIVAVGTSLPELSVSVSAARQGYGDIAVANVIGSNIANIFLVLGVSALVFPISVTRVTLAVIAPFMIFMTILLLIFIKTQWELSRTEGVALLVLYAAFMALLVVFSGA
ncbi:MAG TPA: calcium/sodium antiporter [Desulfobacteria bacterium]|nr:calcium/sodium antiporter [Desulfobacteria bacterium]